MEGEKEVEVLLLARVRGRCHQQQVAGDLSEDLPEPVALRSFELVAVVVGGHLVSLVDNAEVPVSRLEFRDQVLLGA